MYCTWSYAWASRSARERALRAAASIAAAVESASSTMPGQSRVPSTFFECSTLLVQEPAFIISLTGDPISVCLSKP